MTTASDLFLANDNEEDGEVTALVSEGAAPDEQQDAA
jgi:hypothetical protein